MRIAGRKIEGSNVELCVIPRGEGEDIVIRAAAVLDMTPFDKICPQPKPSMKLVKGGKKVEDIENPNYLKTLENYGRKRFYYMILKSLQATEGLEWDTVDIADPDTWENYETELKDAGFSVIEINRIVTAVTSANCLNEEKLEKARKDFLAMVEAKEESSSSHQAEALFMDSGERVSG